MAVEINLKGKVALVTGGTRGINHCRPIFTSGS